MPFTIRATTSVLVLPRACNDAFSKTTNVKSSATYDIPFRRRNSDVVREYPLACTEKRWLRWSMSTTLPQLFEKDAWRSDIDLAPLLGFCKLSHVAVDGCRLPNLPAPRSAADSVRAPASKPRNG